MANVTARYLIVEVIDYYNDGSATKYGTLYELDFLYQGSNVDYSLNTVNGAYDKITNNTPYAWGNANRLRDNVVTVTYPVYFMGNSSYSPSNPSYSGNLNAKARFVVDFGSNIVFDEIRVWSGGSSNSVTGTIKNLNIYKSSVAYVTTDSELQDFNNTFIGLVGSTSWPGNTVGSTVQRNIIPTDPGPAEIPPDITSFTRSPTGIVNVGGLVTWTVTATGDVDSYTFYKNSIQVQSGASNQYSYNLDSGNNSVYVVANGPAGSDTSSTINVEGNDPPSVSIVADTSGTHQIGTEVNISATVVDDQVGGPVQNVEFFLNGVSQEVDSSDPYEFNFTIIGGSNEIHAVVTDANNLTHTSNSISLFGYLGSGNSEFWNDAGDVDTTGYNKVQEGYILNGDWYSTNPGGATRAAKWLKSDQSDIIYKPE